MVLRPPAVSAFWSRWIVTGFGVGDPSFLLGVTKPTLLISGDRDNYSPIPSLQTLFAKLPEPKALITVPGADHFFWGQEEEVAKAAVEFLQKD